MNIVKILSNRSWNSLTDVKKFLQSSTTEKVESFNGYEIVTERFLIGLVHGKIKVRKRYEIT